jgi:hypothetical protein
MIINNGGKMELLFNYILNIIKTIYATRFDDVEHEY